MADRDPHPVALRALAYFDSLFPPEEPVGLPVAQVEVITVPLHDEADPENPVGVVEMLLAEFVSIVDVPFSLKPELRSQCLNAATKIDVNALKPKSERLKGFFYSVKSKLKLNAKRAQALYDHSASRGVIFNYREKSQIITHLDRGDLEGVNSVVKRKPEAFARISSFLTNELSVNDVEALSALRAECKQTINPRLKKVDHTMTDRMLEAIFSSFFFEAFERDAIHAAIARDEAPYDPDFWRYLHHGREHLFDRDNALWFARVDQAWAEDTYDRLRNRVAAFVTQAYVQLNNHGILSLFIDDVRLDGQSRAWELAADVTLYAERFSTEVLSKGFFQKGAIEAETRAYVDELSQADGAFERVNGGFSYLDCFVIRSDESGDSIRLLLLFQKHRRDETLIPCPACRSTNVQGNSYSSLGVRSWECQNYVCPDRSKSNRGKRYSFLSLLKQEALEDQASTIPAWSLQKWRRDVVSATFDDALEMVVKHYSLADDGVTIVGVDAPASLAGRRVSVIELPAGHEELFERFVRDPFFDRFLVDKDEIAAPTVIERGDSDFLVLQGDAYEVLHTLETNSIDGAVTSPPYYNARDYAQWSNIYCHMYDMYNVAREVLRVLRPGSLYLYNVFDYFDNDRTVTFSAMGDKRLALSALTVHAFRSAGFTMLGNVVWDKGEIEGKRGFNGGNASPYYQAPFNCWEHVLVFAKPGPDAMIKAAKLPSYLRAKPVIKMVRGQNVHGHTAPFPDAIPGLLTALLPAGSCVLDPFAGSMTTGRVAERFGIRSVSIERDPSFVELGLRLRADSRRQRNLLAV